MYFLNSVVHDLGSPANDAPANVAPANVAPAIGALAKLYNFVKLLVQLLP